MPRSLRQPFACLALAATLAAPLPSRAADLPLTAGPVPAYGGGYGAALRGGGGFRVAGIPVRPVPVRYDIYGYPLIPGAPAPLAVGNGCPPALEPTFDPDGNLAGYAPIPMCR